jgi:hypothetical protein
MKTIAAATFLAALAGFATSARADHSRVTVGVTLGSNYNAPAYVATPGPVRYAPEYARGHWEDVTTKMWVPGRWIESRNRWGRVVRTFENGHMEYRTDRVWVEAPRAEYRNYGYGYRDERDEHRVWNR